ncbi:TPA: hypothetical protein N0F65_003288 [Lagenidium giganteum]|uniref:Integrase catalytic domain-containing protein n=1 Tax=Lagenidium giganteum TaxID=4803 RepID=A0AAV2YUA0_9STRA|nr:TPA: hypothetical protein N0F65_003288 [Lagenidium giganteum]
MKCYLAGELQDLSENVVRCCRRTADAFEVGQRGCRVYLGSNSGADESRDSDNFATRDIAPQEILHRYHCRLEGGHQGVAKGRPALRAPSPGNIVAVYPFEVIAMDHIPSLPESYRGNTERLMVVDLHSGFVICKASNSRSAKTVASIYKEAVFRRFGASKFIRHDREAGFLSDFFAEFSRLMGQRQSATSALRPQANGMAERKVQKITRAMKMYVSDSEQRDWDEYAERLVLALNTAVDDTRKQTPFCFVHGWDPKSTVEASPGMAQMEVQDRDPRRWRFAMQRSYMQTRSHASPLIKEATEARSQATTRDATPDLKVEVGPRCGSSVAWPFSSL